MPVILNLVAPDAMRAMDGTGSASLRSPVRTFSADRQGVAVRAAPALDSPIRGRLPGTVDPLAARTRVEDGVRSACFIERAVVSAASSDERTPW